MNKRVSVLAILAVSVLLGAGAWAQTTAEQTSATPWLHVRVTEGDSDTNVNLNLPLTAVEAVVALMPERIMSRGRVRLHRHHELSVSDIRRMWNALRDTGDGEFVSVDSDDGRLRVARRGDVIQIRFEGRDDDERNVRVKVPVAVVDALLSGDDDSLNLAAAIEALKDRRGDIVRITDGNERVRIWIDEEQ